MALRWCAARMNEEAKQFRRVNSHPHLPAFPNAIETEAVQRRNAETGHTPRVRSQRGLSQPPSVAEAPRKSGLPPGAPADGLLSSDPRGSVRRTTKELSQRWTCNLDNLSLPF